MHFWVAPVPCPGLQNKHHLLCPYIDKHKHHPLSLVTSILLWNLLAVELEEFLLVVQSCSHVFRICFYLLKNLTSSSKS